METRKFGMWKTGSVKRSQKSLINLNFLFNKKVSKESRAVFIFSTEWLEMSRNYTFWAQKWAEENRKKYFLKKTPDFPESS